MDILEVCDPCLQEKILLTEAMNDSFVVKWVTYGVSKLGDDEEFWFSKMLHSRHDLMEIYPQSYRIGWDIVRLIGVCARYVSDMLSQLINVNIRIDK